MAEASNARSTERMCPFERAATVNKAQLSLACNREVGARLCFCHVSGDLKIAKRRGTGTWAVKAQDVQKHPMTGTESL